MRLVCPNCGAQYEVDDRVVPDSGRDVQCSACGHGWYQMPAGRDEAVEPEPPVDEQVIEDELDEAGAELDEPDAPLSEPELPDEEDEGEDELPPAAAAGKPREIDEGVRSILQEEAQRELEARDTDVQHDPEQVETQPELGLDAGPSPDEERRRIARERMARMRGLDDDEPEADFDAASEPAEEAEAPSHGRALFPDIEEINSTLDSHAPGAEAGIDGADAEAGGRSGFSRGFTVVIVIAILFLVVYLLAPKIVASVPALEPALSAYVAAVNEARAWLDGALRGAIGKIEAMTGSGG